MVIIFYSGIYSSLTLARELLDRPDEFITMNFGEKEYGISNIKRVATHANVDDTVTHLT